MSPWPLAPLGDPTKNVYWGPLNSPMFGEPELKWGEAGRVKVVEAMSSLIAAKEFPGIPPSAKLIFPLSNTLGSKSTEIRFCCIEANSPWHLIRINSQISRNTPDPAPPPKLDKTITKGDPMRLAFGSNPNFSAIGNRPSALLMARWAAVTNFLPKSSIFQVAMARPRARYCPAPSSNCGLSPSGSGLHCK